MSKITPEIFRAYDIRGTYPDQINGQASFAIARAFMRFLKEEPMPNGGASKGDKQLTICVGQDARPSSPELFEGFVKGIAAEGGRVVDIGLAMTPALYFAVLHYGYDGGVNITASHNPNPFNGLKMVRNDGMPIGSESGLMEIQKYAEESEGSYTDDLPRQRRGAEIEKKDIISDYIEENLELAGVAAGSLGDMRVAMDVGNGVAGEYATALLHAFPRISCTHLYFEPDGNFPNHDPDPTVAKNLEDIKEVMKQEEYTCGVVFDGDADRVLFIDEQRREVDGGLLLALISCILLREHPGAHILYTASATRAIADIVAKHGGTTSMTRIGNAFIKPQMQKENAFFAGEFSGHYTIGDGRFYEVPFVVILLVLKEIEETGKKLSELIEDVRGGWYTSGEVNIPVENEEKQTLLQKVEEAFPDGKINKLDGVRVDYPDWWFILRPSNTESLIRLSVEADSPEKMQEKLNALTHIIHGE